MHDLPKQHCCPLCGIGLDKNTFNKTVIHMYNNITGKCEDVEVEHNNWQVLAGNRVFAEKISNDINLN